MTETEIIEINGELGIVLPEELLTRLNLHVDSEVYLTQSENSLKLFTDKSTALNQSLKLK